MAAALLWIHRESLQAFRKELRQHRLVWAKSVKVLAERFDAIEEKLEGRPQEDDGVGLP